MLARIGRGLLLGLGAVALTFAVAILWPTSSAPLPGPTDDYLIANVRVIDVEAGEAGEPTDIVVRDGVIVSIGTGARHDAGLTRIDGRGAYVVPGFWDMHTHAFRQSPQLHLPLFVANGVTNVRDLMDCPQPADSLIACAADKQRWNRAVETGHMTAPRIVEVASYYLEDPSLTPGEVSSRAAVYEARGIDALKVYNRLPRPAYLQAAAEARSRGMRLVGHLPKAISLDEAVAAGQVSIEHAHAFARHCFRRAADWRRGRLDGLAPLALTEAIVAEHQPAACRTTFAAMRAAGTWYVPTHVTREEDARAADPRLVGDSRLAYLDPLSRWAYNDDLAGTVAAYPGRSGRRALDAYFRHGLRLTGAAHSAGVQVLVGTDTAIGGFRYHDEMGHLVRAGLTPAAVLKAATIDAARYAGLEASSGSVSVGKRADLVLLEANPLDDIAHTRRIRAVLLKGRLYDRPHLDALLEFVRGQAGAPHNWAKLLWNFARSSVTADL